MALLFADSFDHYATADILSKPYNVLQGVVSGGNPVTIAAVGRNGTNGLLLQGLQNGLSSVRGFLQKSVNPGSSASGGVGFAFSQSSLSQGYTNGTELLRVLEGSTCHLSVVVNQTTGTFSVRLNTTTISTSTFSITSGVFYYLEFKWTINNSTGSFNLRINNVSILSASGIDTQNAGTGVWNTIQLSSTGTTTGVSCSFDDFVIWDTTGSDNNDFTGDVRVIGSIASSGNGSNTDFTPSTGTNHGALVDESTPNTSDYNSSNTVGDRDTYNFPALGVAGIVLGVQTVMYAQKSDAGSRAFAPVHRIGGVNYDGTSISLPSSWLYLLQMYERSPATAALWTTSEIDAAETGVKVTV